MQSTVTNDKREYFGVGSLWSYINGKKKYPGNSSSFTSLQTHLEEANRKIEEQAAREAGTLWVAAKQEADIKHLTIMKKYLRVTNPNFLTFFESQPIDPATTCVKT